MLAAGRHGNDLYSNDRGLAGQQTGDITFVAINALPSSKSSKKGSNKSPEKNKCEQEANMSCFRMETSGRDIDLYKFKPGKPPFSYASLIGKAMLEAPGHKLTLCAIYNWIVDNFPFYKSSDHSWKNAIRRNLSLHKFFIRVENTHGSYWTLDKESYSARRTKTKHDSSH